MTVEKRYKHQVTFGMDDGAPSLSVASSFQEHSMMLSAPVAQALRGEFLSIDHDLSNGSDHLFIIGGLITQVAAELWAAERIRISGMAQLTVFHHARAIYEAHAVAHWLMQDVESRWMRIMKDRLRERYRLEEEASVSTGCITTDISSAGHALLKDQQVKFPPTVFEMVRTDPLLRFDLAYFWKYASAHIHAGNIGTASVEAETERNTLEQLLAGTIRHAAGAYRKIVDHYSMSTPEVLAPLEAAERWSSYDFDLPVPM